MYNLNDDNQRRMPQQIGYDHSTGTNSARGSLIALLVLVVVMGGLVLLGSIGNAPVDPAATGTGTEIQNGADTQTLPSTGTIVD